MWSFQLIASYNVTRICALHGYFSTRGHIFILHPRLCFLFPSRKISFLMEHFYIPAFAKVTFRFSFPQSIVRNTPRLSVFFILIGKEREFPQLKNSERRYFGRDAQESVTGLLIELGLSHSVFVVLRAGTNASSNWILVWTLHGSNYLWTRVVRISNSTTTQDW